MVKQRMRWHVGERTKVMSDALPKERIGECLGFLDGITIDFGPDGALPFDGTRI
jgi:hypothetical protein